MDIKRTDEKREIRNVRSYVLRENRFTKAQKKAMLNLLPHWEIDIEKDDLIDFTTIFHNQQNITLEIGFGMGKSLIEEAVATPNQNFVGVEVYGPGVGSCLQAIEEFNLSNVRVIKNDIVVAMEKLPNESINKVQIFFPDPWPKKKHHKRRLIQIPFMQNMYHKLKNKGQIHIATDWEDYATHIIAVFKELKGFVNTSSQGDYVPKPKNRPTTKFEQRGENLGHGVWDMIFEKRI